MVTDIDLDPLDFGEDTPPPCPECGFATTETEDSYGDSVCGDCGVGWRWEDTDDGGQWERVE